MKQFLCLLLAVAVLVSLCACGKAAPEEESSSTTTTATGGSTSRPTVPAVKPVGGDGSISLLAVGDGLILDAMETYLYDLFRSAGYKTIRLGILYAEGSTIDTLRAAMTANKQDYLLRQNTDGKWSAAAKVTPMQALRAADWDCVVLQQGAADAGLPATYTMAGKIATQVKNYCPNAVVYWHMTWAYQQNSSLAGFSQYKSNQTAMYQAICYTTQQKVLNSGDISGVIPTGTAIQNLRASSVGDTLTSDGIRLNDCGDYTAALTWYCYLTVQRADTVAYHPDAVADCFDDVAVSVNNAIVKPFTAMTK